MTTSLEESPDEAESDLQLLSFFKVGDMEGCVE
jgi:hypothetical protein